LAIRNTSCIKGLIVGPLNEFGTGYGLNLAQHLPVIGSLNSHPISIRQGWFYRFYQPAHAAFVSLLSTQGEARSSGYDRSEFRAHTD